MENSISVGVSVPRILLQKLDAARGLASRSKYLQHLLTRELQAVALEDRNFLASIGIPIAVIKGMQDEQVMVAMEEAKENMHVDGIGSPCFWQVQFSDKIRSLRVDLTSGDITYVLQCASCKGDALFGSKGPDRNKPARCSKCAIGALE